MIFTLTYLNNTAHSFNKQKSYKCMHSGRLCVRVRVYMHAHDRFNVMMYAEYTRIKGISRFLFDVQIRGCISMTFPIPFST